MDIAQIFLDKGVLGAVIIALAYTVIWQQKRVDKKDEEIKLLNEAIGVVQEKRLVDSEKTLTNFINLGKDIQNSQISIVKTLDNVTRLLEVK